MKVFRTGIAALMGMALLAGFLAAPALAQTNAQRPNQPTQQAVQSDHMMQMNQMMNRMNELVNRLHAMHQAVDQKLNGDQQMGDNPYFRHLQDLEASMGDVGEHMKQTIERYNALTEDKQAIKESMTDKDVTALKDQLSNLTIGMEKAINTLESMNNRIAIKKEK